MAGIAMIAPQLALQRARAGALLLDVREQQEVSAGLPEGALHLPMSEFGARYAEVLPDREREVLLLCAVSPRAERCAMALAQIGYAHVAVVAGGYSRWLAEGLPCRLPNTLDSDAAERYARHLLLPEVGADGQQRLGNARILLVGAGGLGSPAALYLAAAGIGTLTLVDDDRVERSNLQRQVLHSDASIGRLKVDSARTTLAALNPRVRIHTQNVRLNAENVDALLDGQDLAIDGSDNFPTRYLLNDACVRHGLPLVYGAVQRFFGQVSVFWPAATATAPCYRCLFPEPPPAGAAPSCAEAGVLGVLPGIIGMLQATEAIKLILGIGTPLIGRLLSVDALSMRFNEARLSRDPACAVCKPGGAFQGYRATPEYCR